MQIFTEHIPTKLYEVFIKRFFRGVHKQFYKFLRGTSKWQALLRIEVQLLIGYI